MFKTTQKVVIAVAALLVIGGISLSETSLFWNFIGLPIVLTGLGLILAGIEYLQASRNANQCQVFEFCHQITQEKHEQDKAA